MSEKLYQLCWKYRGTTIIHRGEPTTDRVSVEVDARKNNAKAGNKIWWVEPFYEPPAIVAEDDLTTTAGSPCMGGDDDLDLLGVKPPC